MNQQAVTFHDFELEIRPGEVRLIEASAGTSTQAGPVRNHQFQGIPDSDLARLEEIIVQTREQALSRSDPTVRLDDFAAELQDEARSLGQALFEAVFPKGSALVNKYIGSYHQAMAAGDGRAGSLRVRLWVSPQLSHIPWEILAAGPDLPGENDFLALKLSLSRRPATRTGPAEPYEKSLPLRLLLVADDPFLEEQARLEKQKELIFEALSPLAGRIEIHELKRDKDDRSTLETLDRYLRSQEYQIVHFMGHGYYDTEQDPPVAYLNMTREDQLHQYAAGEVADVFRAGVGQKRGLRLVVFNSCESAQARPAPNYSGMAQSLLDVGVPAVLGMQHLLSDPAAQHLARAFYTRLAATLSVDEAVRHAREQINLQITGTLEWLTPVLYYTGEGPLFIKPAEDPVLARHTYLHLLRQTTDVIPADQYLPVMVTRSTTVVHSARDGSAVAQAEMTIHAATNTQSPTADARDVLVDRQSRQPTRPVNILLGEPGSGKSTVIDQVVGRMLSQEEVDSGQTAAAGRELIPVRVTAVDADWSSIHDGGLAVLAYRALSQAWSSPVAAEILASDRRLSQGFVGLPSLSAIRRWMADDYWRFLFIVEDIEKIEPEDRRQVGAELRQLIQTADHHPFIITSNANSFAEYAPYLGQSPQWQIAPLTERTVLEELHERGLSVEQEGMLDMLRQPWALFTYIRLAKRGEGIRDQAALLRAHVNRILEGMPLLLRPRIRQTLMLLAMYQNQRLGDAGAMDQAPVSELFNIMKEVRGERSYSLEELYQNLIQEGVLQADPVGETVRFSSYHIQAILSALAMDQALKQDPDGEPAGWDVANLRLRMTFILLSQLGHENQRAVVKRVLEHLSDDLLAHAWEKRLELLDLAVHCFHHRDESDDDHQREMVIYELIRTLLNKEEEGRLSDLGTANYLEGAEYSLCRLQATTMRIRAVRLLGYVRDRRAFEPLRWLIVEPVRRVNWCGGNRLHEPQFALSGVRRAAGLALFQMWQDRSLGLAEMLARGEGEMGRLAEIMAAWADYQEGEEKKMGAAFGKLVAWLKEEEDSWLSSIAAVAIAEIGGHYQEHPLREPAVDVLVEAFTEASGDTRWAIADGAGSLSFLQPEDTRPLLEKLQEVAIARRGEQQFAHRASQRESAVYALGKLRRPEALASLRNVLMDRRQPEGVAARTARSIGQCSVDHPDHDQVPGALDDLTRVVLSFKDSELWDSWTRREAIGSLGYIGDDRTVQTLIEVIRDDASDRRLNDRAVLALLQVLGREEAGRRLQEAMPSSRSRIVDDGVIFRLLAALAEIDPLSAVRVLNERYRRWLIKALDGERLDRETAELVVALLLGAAETNWGTVREFLNRQAGW